MSSNVVHAAPAAPPGPATFDRSRFSGGTRMVDTANLVINANLVQTCRLRAFGDPADPTAPAISAPAIATQILMAPYFDAANVANVNPTVLLGNNCTYFTESVFVQKSLTVGKPFTWTPPAFTVISSPTIRLNGGTFAQTYPLNGGQLRGFFPLFVPQPPLATQGQLLNLNGGVVSGVAKLYK